MGSDAPGTPWGTLQLGAPWRTLLQRDRKGRGQELDGGVRGDRQRCLPGTEKLLETGLGRVSQPGERSSVCRAGPGSNDPFYHEKEGGRGVSKRSSDTGGRDGKFWKAVGQMTAQGQTNKVTGSGTIQKSPTSHFCRQELDLGVSWKAGKGTQLGWLKVDMF